MKVKKSLQVNIAVLVIAAFLIVLIGFLALTRVNQAVKESEIANEIVNSAFERNTFRDDYLRTSSERAKIQWHAKSEQLSRLLRSASDTLKYADYKRTIDELIENNESSIKLFSEIVQNREKARAGEVPAELFKETEDRLVTQLSMKAYDRVLRTRQLRESAREHLLVTLRMAAWSTFFVIAVMTAAAAINSWAIGRMIINRIQLLRNGASVIGEGNLDHRIEIKSKDELADLSAAFNAMTAKLQSSDFELRESEKRYRALISASSQVLYQMNPDWTEMRQLRGGSVIADTERPNRNWLKEYIHPDDQELVLEAIAESVRSGKVFELEHRVGRLDGTIGWVFSRAVPMRNAAGDVVEWFGAASDITDRKRAEEGLRTERDRAQRYLDIAGVLLIVLNSDQRVALINQKGCEILGWSENEIVGKNWFDHFLPAANREKTKEVFDKIMLGAIAPFEYHENPVVTSKGAHRLIAWHNSLIKDESGKIIGTLSSGEDITERKQAEGDIDELNRQLTINVRELESSNREMEAFIYSVAHDLRSPLRSISGFSEILLKRYADLVDEKGKKHFHSIIRNAGQMNKIIDDLLHLSRISRHEIHKEDVDMSAILQSMTRELQAAQPGRRVSVKIKEGIHVLADPRLMQVALSNLLNNAWKFTSRTADARIEFGALGREGKTVYFVKDNGAGFDQLFAERIFLPFHRLHTEEEFEGTGIGLAIVERAIRRHGGRIWAEGKKNEGATFFFTLS